MKKTMFKRIFAGIAAVFTLGLCVPTGFTGTDLKPSFEAVAEDEWLDMYGIEYKIKDRDTLIIKDSDCPGWSFIDDGFESYAADIKHLQIGKGWKIHSFRNLTAIESLTIGDNCIIEANAFWECTSLTSVKIGDDCNIGERAFWERTSLTSVKIGNGCTIREEAFWDCTSLTSVTIGNGCTIGRWVFSDCNSIQKVICKGSNYTVTVDDHNPEIICNKDKWITATKCPKCQGWVIDYICEFCGYIDETTVKAEIEANEAEIEAKEAEIKQKEERNAYLSSLLKEQETQSETEPPTTTEEGNTATTFSDGSILAIIGGSTFLILCGLAAVIIVKKRKKTE